MKFGDIKIENHLHQNWKLFQTKPYINYWKKTTTGNNFAKHKSEIVEERNVWWPIYLPDPNLFHRRIEQFRN